MIEIKTKVRKWGNSLGLVVPADVALREHITEGQEVKVILAKGKNVLQEIFGTFKFKKTTQQMMEEINKELYND